MPRLQALLGHTAFLWAIGGCTVASAADGSATSAATTRGRLSASGPSNAVPPSQPVDTPPHRPPHEPPKEAFEACESLTEGAACSVTFRGQTRSGTCRKGPRGESKLACVPERPPGPPPSDSNQTLSDTALERQLDQLEREIRGS